MRAGPALVADIGGTNARFALADPATGRLARVESAPCARFSGPEAALEAYLAALPQRPARAAIAVAGPVVGGAARLTNLGWRIGPETLRAAGVPDARILNDFEALARALPDLGEGDLQRIGGGAPVPAAAKAALGPGTGLGIAALLPDEAGWRPVASEGGHATFPARAAGEVALLDRLFPDARVSAERILSGPGLAAVYGALAGGSVAPATAPEVVARARAGEAAAAEALDRFVVWLGRFAGDVALMFAARGGVYLGGGIAPRIADEIAGGGFRAAFEDKGRLAGYLAAIPVFIILAPDAGLRGAARALAAP
jgi:glucokinase